MGVFQNKMQKQMHGHKNKEVTGGKNILHNVELNTNPVTEKNIPSYSL
jgi:hypothetical protein